MIDRPSLRTDLNAGLPRCSPQQLLQEMSVAFPYQPMLLITGEHGTGKATLARQLHAARTDRLAQFVEIHCRCEAERFQKLLAEPGPVSLPEEGSSGPSRIRQTVLLREIEALSAAEQLSLLKRVDEAGVNQGGEERFLLTTSRNIQHSFAGGLLRHEFYYRLNTYRFHLPPLRERPAELLSLTRQFVKLFAERYQKKIDRIDEGLIRLLSEHPWPGNLRELQYVIERAVIYCSSAALTASDLPADFQTSQSTAASNQPASTPGLPLFPWKTTPEALESEETLEVRVAEMERDQIEKALERNFQSRTHAARDLGISRVTLYNKMKKLGLETQKSYPT